MNPTRHIAPIAALLLFAAAGAEAFAQDNGADLRGLDLGTADLLGADLRNADLRGADLSRSLFLTQPQVTAARGDASTRLPSVLQRPVHWDGR